MSKRGGYQILDLKDTALTSGKAAVIKGTSRAMSRHLRSRVVISGLNLDGVLYSDVTADSVTITGTTYTIQGGGVTVTVSDDDSVTVSPTTPAEGPT